jgi:hypothetical protein
LTTSLPVALVAVGVALGAILVMDIVVTTAVRRQVPDELCGRAMWLLQMSCVLAGLVGSLIAPVAAARWGVWVVLTTMGISWSPGSWVP